MMPADDRREEDAIEGVATSELAAVELLTRDPGPDEIEEESLPLDPLLEPLTATAAASLLTSNAAEVVVLMLIPLLTEGVVEDMALPGRRLGAKDAG
jgi:hypothetical protein